MYIYLCTGTGGRSSLRGFFECEVGVLCDEAVYERLVVMFEGVAACVLQVADSVVLGMPRLPQLKLSPTLLHHSQERVFSRVLAGAFLVGCLRSGYAEESPTQRPARESAPKLHDLRYPLHQYPVLPLNLRAAIYFSPTNHLPSFAPSCRCARSGCDGADVYSRLA